MKWLIFTSAALTAALAVYTACTVEIDTGEPQINLGCVYVVLGSSTVKYCDAGASTPADAAKDSPHG